MKLKSWTTGIVVSALLTLAFVGPAAAKNQVGDTLVNVQIEDVTIAVPIAIAANLCDIRLNVLARQVEAGDTDCTATATSIASPGTGGGSNGNQAGNSLVNVQINDVTVLVPIALAANLCDVDINVLAVQLAFGEATCDASALAVA